MMAVIYSTQFVLCHQSLKSYRGDRLSSVTLPRTYINVFFYLPINDQMSPEIKLSPQSLPEGAQTDLDTHEKQHFPYFCVATAA